MSENKYYIVNIGVGLGGYHTAERAGAICKKVVLIEKDKKLGGVCLNRGVYQQKLC